MARSSYVYVVMNVEDVIAAFTVKHELIAWLKRYDGHDYLTVTRVPDGGRCPERKPTNMPVKYLLGLL